MDGNGRWATSRAMPRKLGHRAGVEAAKKVVKAAEAQGVRYLTLFGFSTENWERPQEEVTELMSLLKLYLKAETAELHKNNVRIRMIGFREHIAPDILELINHAEALTRDNDGLQLSVAFNYGGRQDIMQAVKSVAKDMMTGQLSEDALDQDLFGTYLLTRDLPAPDLLIRSSGEQRISNFLLWQCAYSEMVFVDKYWPDFDGGALEQAIAEYQGRERRFGQVSSQIKHKNKS
tara:strand:- start:469 stop:1167 length:699 start_codon:yes stop_codon:yes gene_type:complete